MSIRWPSAPEAARLTRYDLAGIDPPHTALLDLVFQSSETRDSLIAKVATSSPWLVMYVGHATQLGRQHLVEVLLGKHYQRVAWFRLGQEVVVVGGPDQHDGATFDDMIQSVQDRAAVRLRKNGWPLESLPSYRPKVGRMQPVGRKTRPKKAVSDAHAGGERAGGST